MNTIPKLSLAGWIATWFGAGFFPKAPGTFGTFVALPFAWVIASSGGMIALLLAASVLFFAGVWASDRYMEETQSEHDPSVIVVDEVMGVWLLLAAMPQTWQGYVLGFLVFRLFDIWKPWPIRHFDHNVPGGFGVMLDDFLAAFYPVCIWFVLVIGFWITGHGEMIEMLSTLLDH